MRSLGQDNVIADAEAVRDVRARTRRRGTNIREPLAGSTVHILPAGNLVQGVLVPLRPPSTVWKSSRTNPKRSSLSILAENTCRSSMLTYWFCSLSTSGHPGMAVVFANRGCIDRHSRWCSARTRCPWGRSCSQRAPGRSPRSGYCSHPAVEARAGLKSDIGYIGALRVRVWGCRITANRCCVSEGIGPLNGKQCLSTPFRFPCSRPPCTGRAERSARRPDTLARMTGASPRS